MPEPCHYLIELLPDGRYKLVRSTGATTPLSLSKGELESYFSSCKIVGATLELIHKELDRAGRAEVDAIE
jgi:hypothetical protein